MLRKLILTTAVLVGALAITSQAVAFNYTQTQEDEEHVMPASDRWTPWPWSLAQPFPWSDIQGLWKVDQDEFVSYFAFKVVIHKGTGIRQLQVKQFDGDSCRVLATGVGIETDKKILAQMTSKGGMIYRMELTAFSEKSLRDKEILPLKGNIPVDGALVLSMSSFDNPDPVNKFHMQIVKVSTIGTQKFCFEDIRK